MVVKLEAWLLALLWRRACARGAELPLGDVRLVAGPEALRLVPGAQHLRFGAGGRAQDGREPGGAS